MISADTNVFVYLHQSDAPQKRAAAQWAVARLQAVGGMIGVQVVGEMQQALRRKSRQPAATAAAEALVLLQAFPSFPPTAAAARHALTMMSQGRSSYWDGLLFASALEAGVTTMLTEDDGGGRAPAGLTLINPFAPGGGLSPAARAVLES